MAPKGSDIITPAQCRAARAFLNMSARELAEASGVHRVTIARYEAGQTDIIMANAKVLRLTFEEAGVEFPDLETVRLPRKPRSTEKAAKPTPESA